jgi:hypothetical protein
MRWHVFAALLIAGVGWTSPSRAETQIFVVNGSDGYGIDRCLASGEQCGALAANALCKSRQYAKALTFGRVDHSEVTGAGPEATRYARCDGPNCPETVAITCTR